MRCAGLLLSGCLVAGCSGGDGAASSTGAPRDVVDTSTATAGTATADPSPGAVRPTTTTIAGVPAAGVADTGVPGLDSDDAFCAAWSRWAGSLQVIAVAATFAEVPPESLAALEVVASPVVLAGYDGMLAAWPGELAAERQVAADGLFGPFTRRLTDARDALAAVGAGGEALDAIGAAWTAALATRDPSSPEVTVDLPDDVWAVVDAAAADFTGRRVPFADDPSLQVDVATPATDRYLATACPDQGALTGLEVE